MLTSSRRTDDAQRSPNPGSRSCPCTDSLPRTESRDTLISSHEPTLLTPRFRSLGLVLELGLDSISYSVEAREESGTSIGVVTSVSVVREVTDFERRRN